MAVGKGVFVGVAVGVSVGVGVFVGTGVDVGSGVNVGVALDVGTDVDVGVGVSVGDGEGTTVAVAVGGSGAVVGGGVGDSVSGSCRAALDKDCGSGGISGSSSGDQHPYAAIDTSTATPHQPIRLRNDESLYAPVFIHFAPSKVPRPASQFVTDIKRLPRRRGYLHDGWRCGARNSPIAVSCPYPTDKCKRSYS